MRRLKEKEKVFIKKCNEILKNTFIFVGFVLIFIYLIKGGFNLLVFGLRDSRVLITYSVAIIILLGTLVFLNINEDEKLKDANILSSKHLTNIVCVLIVIFGILFAFSLIDFILPIVILVTSLILFNFIINKLLETLVLKYGLK